MSLHFYAQLPLQKSSVSKIFGDHKAFAVVPEDWFVIITDIKNSTGAVRDGKHQLVNLVATGSIISTINIARKAGLLIPFFFGGDGATILVPSQLKEPVLQSLMKHRENTLNNFQLELRVGWLGVSDIYKQGKSLMIAKAALAKDFDIPLILGEGLRYAERIIKSDDYKEDIQQQDLILDLEGMSCRWDRVEPPEKRLEVVCLLVDVLEESIQRAVFQKVLSSIDNIYGPQQSRNPISTQRLKLTSSWERIATEAKVKFGYIKPFYLLINWILNIFGRYYFLVNPKGKKYLKELVEWSDTLVIDGRISTVITGTTKQRARLVKVLDEMEANGQLLYGIFISPQSIMSCYVKPKEKHHLHFIDGSEGGYTQAASVLKEKWRNFKKE